MDALNSNNTVPIIGGDKIIVTLVPGTVPGTFDVHIDTSSFQYGAPLAVQVLLQATMVLVPVAYEAISNMRNIL